jgi:hypothetical protein
MVLHLTSSGLLSCSKLDRTISLQHYLADFVKFASESFVSWLVHNDAVMGYLQFFFFMCQVGLLDEEKILPIGREITAVGTLDMSLDGYPVIKPSGCLPIFLYIALTFYSAFI